MLTGESVEPLRWPDAVRAISEAPSYWLATLGPDGPRQRPVLAVWVGGALCIATSPAARKARDLARDPACSLAVTTSSVEYVVQGSARRVRERAQLEQVREAYRDAYDWPVEIVGECFDAPYGAPTAGPPPYELHQIVLSSVHAFGIDEQHAPRGTRWRF